MFFHEYSRSALAFAGWPACDQFLRGARIAITALTVVAMADGISRAAPCPSAIVLLGRGATPFAVESPVYDSTYTLHNTAHASFDRTQGHMFLGCSSGGGLSAFIRIVESFDLSGIPSGTPVDGLLEFNLDGWAEQRCGGTGCGILFEGRLVAGADSVAANASHGGPGTVRRNLVTTLVLPVRLVAGSPFEAAFYLEYGTGPGQSNANAQATGTYRISGLPQGVRAIACMGADVTPARRTSWGSLKQRYR